MLQRLLKSYPHLLAVFCFLMLTVVMTWPITARLSTHVTPGQQRVMTVPYLNLWTLAWNHHWLKGHAESYWDANLYYPSQKTLAYSEPQFGLGLITVPLVYLGANTVFIYNLILLLYVWGAGMAVYALCWYLFGTLEQKKSESNLPPNNRWAASVTAGILYGFHFYTFAELGVLQLLALLFPALTFLGLHRFLDRNKWSDTLLFCFGFLGCWYTCAYYGLFLSVFVCCFALKFGYRKVLAMDWQCLVRGMVTAGVTLVCLVPLFVGMLSAKTAMELSRSKLIVRQLSTGLSDYLRIPGNTWLYGELLDVGSSEWGRFLGMSLLILASIGATAVFKTRLPKISTALRLVDSGIKQQKQEALFPKRYGLFYLSMAGFVFWLSFGMALTPPHVEDLGVYRIIAWLSPYNLLYQFVPGFSAIRAPYRIIIFCILFLSVLAGWGVLWLSQRVGVRWRRVISPFILMVVLLEVWPLPARLARVPRRVEELPPIYQHVKELPTEATLIELPLGRGPSERELETEAQALYYSTFHWHPIVNGYSGFTPRAKIELSYVIAESDPETVISALKSFGVQYILAHEDKLNEDEKKKLRFLEGKEVILIAREGTDILYKVNYNSMEVKNSLPPVAALTFYESLNAPDHVTLCLYYQLDENQCELTTPWNRSIAYDVTWYSKSKPSEKVLVSTNAYGDSKLLTRTLNAIEMDLPMPPAGEYKVSVQQHGAPESPVMNGFCRIHESDFVSFEPIL